MHTQTQADLIIEARWLVPVEPDNTVLEHHCVVISQGVIQQVLPTQHARDLGLSAKETLTLDEHILFPGFVNTHTHAAMSLMRGLADDLPLMRWLQEAIWPTEGKHVSPNFVRDGTLLAAAEMLLGGITCVNDMYFFPHSSAQAFAEAGIRATVGMIMIEFPSAFATDAEDYLRKGLRVRDEWKGDPLIQFALAPHAPYTVSDSSFEQIATLAVELDCPVHIHLHETQTEIEDSLKRFGVRPLARLEKLGLLGPNLCIAHGVHFTEHELDTLAHYGAHVIHNPTSNMKLASGAAPITGMLKRGVNVGLGTDGAASNNRLDIFQEMRHAALLAKLRESDASALSAHEALHMATLGGARALGLEQKIGSITPGKAADLCAASLADPIVGPCYDPVSHLVYVLGRNAVSHVWVGGEKKVHEGRLLHMHNKELQRISRMWQNAVRP
ncbi:TRZ/ATZ family hydrolase [Uliginosibacterium gangwonense]|uniref:TRZ/ATZ family hydrolase n=1 Tax=Uliginosibacterium gangwonense TaxID=392736 RepID=UPI00036AEB35|nr:TRZ/ATZ family hydrolase [Uliginosibacterium gangwonense]